MDTGTNHFERPYVPEFTTLEAWTPRLRVKYVPAPDEDRVNTAAADLEAAGHSVVSFQFEVWKQDFGVYTGCWITYSLADDDATTDDGGNNGNT
jgi:hypothetical protein